MDPVFLSLGEVLEIYQDQIDRYGGESGVRDMGLLESALAAPASGSGGGYYHKDLVEMAAAYLFHIAKNHPFVDGNKRVGAVAAVVFLALNDIELDVSEEEFEEAVLSVADGSWNKEATTDFFRKHCKPSITED